MAIACMLHDLLSCTYVAHKSCMHVADYTNHACMEHDVLINCGTSILQCINTCINIHIHTQEVLFCSLGHCAPEPRNWREIVFRDPKWARNSVSIVFTGAYSQYAGNWREIVFRDPKWARNSLHGSLQPVRSKLLPNSFKMANIDRCIGACIFSANIHMECVQINISACIYLSCECGYR